MDADNRIKTEEADQALRDLFQAAGHEAVPQGFDARILQRIAVVKTVPMVADRPLLPKSIWIAGGSLLAGMMIYAIANSNGISDASSIPWQLPKFELAAILSSPWLLMSLAAAGILLGVDVVLSRTVSASSRG